jgi:[acyl-carrier-protein] S-malonyltransferase
MAQALAEVEISAPSVPLIANVRASAVSDPELIRSLLVEQVTGAVRWRETMSYLAAGGVTEVWEVGAGKALSGMIRRIDRAIACQAIGSPEDIAKLQGAAGA